MSRERIRTLKPEFFRDEKVKQLSRDARFLCVGLISRSDDRGRQAREIQAILGHVYPGGDVNAKQLKGWLIEIESIGFACAYEHGPFEYVWLPNFWRHQVINRPTESTYPQHPGERFAHLPIKEAIKAFRDEQLREELTEELTESSSEELRAPRAGARSVPFPSVEVGNTSTENGEVDARVRGLCLQLSASCRSLTETPESSPRYAVTEAWLTDMDRLVRIDGRDPEMVSGAIEWAHNDPFWSRNILSPRKLRQHFDAMGVTAKQARPGVASTAVEDARREAYRREMGFSA